MSYILPFIKKIETIILLLTLQTRWNIIITHMDAIYNNLKKNNGNKNIINQNIDYICNNIRKFTEKEIITLLVDLNYHYKISNDDIIDYSFKILLSIIDFRDYSYGISMKIYVDNIVMKSSQKYYLKLIQVKLLLDHVLMSMNVQIISEIDGDDLLVNYLIYMLTRTCDDCYIIDNIIDVIKSVKCNVKKQHRKTLENQKIKYIRMRSLSGHLLVGNIYKKVFDDLNFLDQHRFRVMSQYFQKFQIVRLDDEKYSRYFNQKILNNYKHVESLNFNNNDELVNLDHMTNLKILNINCATIDEGCIKCLTQLEELHIWSCGKITNLNHMTNLKILNVVGCNIDDESIKNLSRLEELCLSDNDKITNLNHMTNLKILDVSNCMIDDEGIINLSQLEVLNNSLSKYSDYGHEYFTNIKHMTELKKVNLDFDKITIDSYLLLIKRGLCVPESSCCCFSSFVKRFETDSNYGEVIKYFDLILGDNYDRAKCMFLIGDRYQMTRKNEDAIRYYNLASDNGYNKGDCLYQIGRCLGSKRI